MRQCDAASIIRGYDDSITPACIASRAHSLTALVLEARPRCAASALPQAPAPRIATVSLMPGAIET